MPVVVGRLRLPWVVGRQRRQRASVVGRQQPLRRHRSAGSPRRPRWCHVGAGG